MTGQGSRLPHVQVGEWASRLSSLARRRAALIPRLIPFLVAGVTSIVYLLTMAPILSWGYAFVGRDGGDFIGAAWHLGVPHPTGYPTYTMVAWLFAKLPLGTVAWRVQLFSAVSAVGTVVLVYLIGRRLASRQAFGAVTFGAVVGAFLLGFSRLLWSHAVVAEVYALHLFFVALIVWLMLRWRDDGSPLWPAAMAFGLGLGNHVTLTFIVPAVLLLLWDGRKRLTWRGVLASMVALAVGLLVYAYLPWRAAAHPIINWGDPETWEGFKWVVTGEGYQKFFFALPGDQLVPRLDKWLRISNDQFALPPIPWFLAAIGLGALLRRDRWLAWGTVAHASIALIYSVGYDTTDAYVHLMPVYLYLALWMGQGVVSLLIVAYQLSEPGVRFIVDSYLLDGPRRKKRRAARRSALRNGLLSCALLGGVVLGLALLPSLAVIQDWDKMDMTHDREAEDYARGALESVEPGALILVGSDVHTFSLWYYRYVEGIRPDVAVVNDSMMTFAWYRRTVAIHHPDVAQPGPDATRVTKLDLVLRNLDQRAVYIAEDEEDLTGLVLTEVGELWRVTSP